MTRSNRLMLLGAGVAAVAVLLIAFGTPVAMLLPFAVALACPLVMVFMMRGMAGHHAGPEDHTGHGCEHDPTRQADSPASKRQ